MEISTSSGSYLLRGMPNECPFCHKSITPNVLRGHKYFNSLDAHMYCPDGDCLKSFIAYYQVRQGSEVAEYTYKMTRGTISGKSFSGKINEISPAFVMIYNQAFASEQQGLTEICGVGFRKSLEFLIKDYSILNRPHDKDKIEAVFLGNVIENYVTDSRVKSVAKRATWLANDETHYIRKWEGKNLEDLKKLIDLTVHWIEMEALTSSFESEMPG